MDKIAVVKLGLDLAQGKVKNYSEGDPNEVMRKAMKSLMPYTKDGKIDYKAFRKNKWEVYEILEEVVTEVVNEGLQGQFDQFVEYRNVAWGDKPEFEVPNNQLYRVAEVVNGVGDIRRQQLRENELFTVDFKDYAVKIFEEYHRFLAGRVDWVRMMKLIGDSFAEHLKNKIFEVLMATYGKQYTAPYHITGTPDEDKLLDIAGHIQARTGDNVAIYGTIGALRKIEPKVISDNMRDKRNATGYYGVVAGLDAFVIPNNHKLGTDEFQIKDDFVLLLPQSQDRLIKVINEGEAIIQETNAGTTADMVEEYTVINRFGIAVISSRAFGFYKFI